MKAPWGLLLLPVVASAQPAAPYVCTHVQSNPYTGAPSQCEAVSDSVDNPSFEYYFPQAATAADPPSSVASVASVPEVSPEGLASALTLLLGFIACRTKRQVQH